MPTKRMKFYQADTLVGIAALDIVINRIERNNAVDYDFAGWILERLQRKAERPINAVGPREARCILQCIRLTLRAVGNPEMSQQAAPFVNKLERFTHHA